MILALKTSQDPTEIYLLANDGVVIAEKKWDAGRTLAQNLLSEIEQLFIRSHLIEEWRELTGVIIFRGPGSFTGLRIGIATANAVSYARGIPIVGADGNSWLTDGLQKLAAGENDKIVIPEYGTPPHITKPKK